MYRTLFHSLQNPWPAEENVGLFEEPRDYIRDGESVFLDREVKCGLYDCKAYQLRVVGYAKISLHMSAEDVVRTYSFLRSWVAQKYPRAVGRYNLNDYMVIDVVFGAPDMRPHSDKEKEEWLHGVNGIWSGWTYDLRSGPMTTLVMNFVNEIPENQRTPVKVVRHVLSCCDSTNRRDAFMCGRWDGCYDDGHHPTYWKCCYDLFCERALTNSPAKYAQCWVFSEMLTSIFRFLGIPSRTIYATNAHIDRHRDGGIDIGLTTPKGESKGSVERIESKVINDLIMSMVDTISAPAGSITISTPRGRAPSPPSLPMPAIPAPAPAVPAVPAQAACIKKEEKIIDKGAHSPAFSPREMALPLEPQIEEEKEKHPKGTHFRFGSINNQARMNLCSPTNQGMPTSPGGKVIDMKAVVGQDDSIWNFHLWTEVYIPRPDLAPPLNCASWQCLDASPMVITDTADEYEGKKIFGPCSVFALKLGIEVPHDYRYMYSAVNSLYRFWKISPEGIYYISSISYSHLDRDQIPGSSKVTLYTRDAERSRGRYVAKQDITNTYTPENSRKAYDIHHARHPALFEWVNERDILQQQQSGTAPKRLKCTPRVAKDHPYYVQICFLDSLDQVLICHRQNVVRLTAVTIPDLVDNCVKISTLIVNKSDKNWWGQVLSISTNN